MMLAQRVQIRAAPALPSRARAVAVRATVVEEKKSITKAERVKQAALAGVVATSLLVGTNLVAPEEAFAARSGGRVSSSGFSSRRAAPSRAATTVVNQTTVVAPPLVGGFGYGMPFFGGGFGYGMPMFMPVPIFGGLLQLMFLLVIANVVFSIVKGAVNAAGKAGGDKKKDDDWDSL